MNKNKIIKISFCFIMIIFLIISLSQVTLAIDFDIQKKFDGKYDKSEATKNASDILSSFINFIQIVSTGIAIIILVVLGIQYTTAAPEGKAEIKKNMTAYIVGAIIIFSAVGILQIIKTFSNININNQLNSNPTEIPGPDSDETPNEEVIMPDDGDGSIEIEIVSDETSDNDNDGSNEEVIMPDDDESIEIDSDETSDNDDESIEVE